MSDKDTRYKDKDKARGIKQKNLRIPFELEHHFEMMAQFCRENPDWYPCHCRSFKNGRLSKSVV